MPLLALLLIVAAEHPLVDPADAQESFQVFSGM
jgi:hypothetical protein